MLENNNNNQNEDIILSIEEAIKILKSGGRLKARDSHNIFVHCLTNTYIMRFKSYGCVIAEEELKKYTWVMA